jgi:hypothetical protein
MFSGWIYKLNFCLLNIIFLSHNIAKPESCSLLSRCYEIAFKKGSSRFTSTPLRWRKWGDFCIHRFIAAQEPRNETTYDEQIKKKKVVHTHNGILLSHKKKEILSLITIWIDLEIIMLSEISQAQKTNTARAHSKQIDILKAKTWNGC